MMVSHLRRPWGENATRSMDAADAAEPTPRFVVCSFDDEAIKRTAEQIEGMLTFNSTVRQIEKHPRVNAEARSIHIVVSVNGIACQIIVAPLPSDYTPRAE